MKCTHRAVGCSPDCECCVPHDKQLSTAEFIANLPPDAVVEVSDDGKTITVKQKPKFSRLAAISMLAGYPMPAVDLSALKSASYSDGCTDPPGAQPVPKFEAPKSTFVPPPVRSADEVKKFRKDRAKKLRNRRNLG